MTFLQAYQIYYREDQLAGLDYTPYLNETCTPFFENSVIRSLIESGAADDCTYFAVLSHKLREKIGIGKRWSGAIANKSDQPFSPELFESLLRKHHPAVMSFQRHMPHDPVQYADKFHPRLSQLFAHIMGKIGYTWRPEHKQGIYSNFFTAEAHIYKQYVAEMLAPAMDVMADMPELWENSMYGHLPEHLAQAWGVRHYPYHTFVCERMISYFCHIRDYPVLHF